MRTGAESCENWCSVHEPCNRTSTPHSSMSQPPPRTGVKNRPQLVYTQQVGGSNPSVRTRSEALSEELERAYFFI